MAKEVKKSGWFHNKTVCNMSCDLLIQWWTIGNAAKQQYDFSLSVMQQHIQATKKKKCRVNSWFPLLPWLFHWSMLCNRRWSHDISQLSKLVNCWEPERRACTSKNIYLLRPNIEKDKIPAQSKLFNFPVISYLSTRHPQWVSPDTWLPLWFATCLHSCFSCAH